MLMTRSSTPKLSEAARHVVMPSGIRTSSWPKIRKECQRLGITFDPWQEGAGHVIFGRREDGTFASSIGGNVLSIPRQVGKTFFLGAIAFALCMLRPGMLVIWTAHQLATAGETHRAMAAMAKRKKVAPFIKQVRFGSGDESVEFRNGSRILFGARERGFGLGFTKVGLLILDEAQRVTEKTIDDLVPTMNQAVDPMMFMVGTPPRPTDSSDEFKRRRREALSGESDDMVYIECSADPKTRVSAWGAGKVDWDAVESANPSYPTRTPRSAILRMRKQLTADSFQREGLGIWDSDHEGSRAISAEQWTQLEGVPAFNAVPSYAVAFSMDGTRMSLAGGAVAPDSDFVHVELLKRPLHGEVETGLSPLADWFAEIDMDGQPRWRRAAAITLSGSAGAGVLKQLLLDRGVPARKIKVATTAEYLQACEMMRNAVTEKKLTRRTKGQQPLDESIAVCDRDKRGGWVATVPNGDETPTEAISLALWTARTKKRKSNESRTAVVL